MKCTHLKVIALFAIGGLATGLLTIVLAQVTHWIIWVGAGLLFLFGLTMTYMFALKQKWIAVKASWKQYLVVASLIVGSYPIAFLIMIVGAVLYDNIYASIFPDRWRARVYSGNFNTGGIEVGLILAAIASSFFISLAIRVITRKWDMKVLALLILTGIITIPIVFYIPSFLDREDNYLSLFPLGETFFSSLCGYSMLRASPEQD